MILSMIPMGAHLHLDNTIGELSVDAGVIGILGINLVLGIRYGFVRRIFSILGVFAAAAAATALGNAIGDAIDPGDRISGNGWSFVAVFVAVIAAFELLGALFGDRLERIVVVAFNQTTGAIAGVLLAALEAGVLALVAVAAANAPSAGAGASAHGRIADTIRTSVAGSLMVDISTGVRAVLTPVLPGDLAQHLAEGSPAP